MDIQEAVDHFKGQANLARALGVTPTAVWLWRRAGSIPEGRQYQIELLTGGALLADGKFLRRKGRRPVGRAA